MRAHWKLLKLNIGLVRRLMACWSCLTMSVRSSTCGTRIRFVRWVLITFRAATFEPLLSTVTFSGALSCLIACTKNLHPAALSRCVRSRESTVSCLVVGTVSKFPLALYLDVGLVYSSTHPYIALGALERLLRHGQHFDRLELHG